MGSPGKPGHNTAGELEVLPLLQVSAAEQRVLGELWPGDGEADGTAEHTPTNISGSDCVAAEADYHSGGEHEPAAGPRPLMRASAYWRSRFTSGMMPVRGRKDGLALRESRPRGGQWRRHVDPLLGCALWLLCPRGLGGRCPAWLLQTLLVDRQAGQMTRVSGRNGHAIRCKEGRWSSPNTSG